MASRRISIGLEGDSLERLDEHSRETGESRSAAAARLIEEGLRMARHPGIVFRDGATGRRPALADGPQVWALARIFRERPLDSDDAIERVAADTAERMELPPHAVLAAIRYYLEYRDEIDDWMRRLDEEPIRPRRRGFGNGNRSALEAASRRDVGPLARGGGVLNGCQDTDVEGSVLERHPLHRTSVPATLCLDTGRSVGSPLGRCPQHCGAVPRSAR